MSTKDFNARVKHMLSEKPELARVERDQPVRRRFVRNGPKA